MWQEVGSGIGKVITLTRDVEQSKKDIEEMRQDMTDVREEIRTDRLEMRHMQSDLRNLQAEMSRLTVIVERMAYQAQSERENLLLKLEILMLRRERGDSPDSPAPNVPRAIE